MNWKIQIPFRKIKKVLESTLKENLNLANFSHIALFSESAQLIHITGPNALHYYGLSQSVNAAKSIFKLTLNQIIVTNDPSFGSPRLCDINFIKCVPKGFVVIQISLHQLLHSPKIFSATQSTEEGFKIPPTPLDFTGQVETALIDYLSASHIDKSFLKEVFSKVYEAFNKVQNILKELEAQDLKDLNLFTENVFKKSLERFPDGETSYTYKDLNVKLKTRQHLCTLAFPSIAKESLENNLNCSYFLTASASLWFFLSLIDDEIPINEGILKCISIEAPIGSVVNCSSARASLLGYYLTTNKIIGALFEIYKKLFPKETKSLYFSPTTFLLSKTENSFFTLAFGQGTNADFLNQGISAVICDSHNISQLSVEKLENTYPIQFSSIGLNPQTEQANTIAGGSGIKAEITYFTDAEVYLLNTYSGKSKDSKNVFSKIESNKNVLVQTLPGNNYQLPTAE
ncbi:MAG: hydantoinase B/oxoprolinase family protein [Oligoflexia bacterium]|nr:hydantoinase B/oxoprolinase family protein [Oligoflexia bacterium]